MKASLFILLFILGSVVFANSSTERSDKSPIIDKPVVPGTRVPVENLNTAPTDPPINQESKKSRFILKNNNDKRSKKTSKGPTRNDVRPKVPLGKPLAPHEKQSQESSSEIYGQDVEDFTNPPKQ